jgi:regulatory protein
LAAKSSDQGVVDEVLDALEAQSYQSDERFVEQYIHSRKRKGYGPLRIRSELRGKGIDQTLLEAWLDERDPEWGELLQQTAARKFGDTLPADFKERAKRARFLEYRGFSAELIRRFLSEL